MIYLTGELTRLKATADHGSAAATEIGLACRGEDSEYMVAVWDCRHGYRLPVGSFQSGG